MINVGFCIEYHKQDECDLAIDNRQHSIFEVGSTDEYKKRKQKQMRPNDSDRNGAPAPRIDDANYGIVFSF